LRFIFLDLDQASAHRRVAARASHLFPPTLVASQFATLESPSGEPGVLRLDATLTPAELLSQSLRWLASPSTPHACPMNTSTPAVKPWPYRLADTAMALTLGVMAASVFLNVVLRYGFGSGIAASEELSRLLFVWMVFIGATAAYPLGEHMAFTSLLLPLRDRWNGSLLRALTFVIHALVVLACALVGWGAWQQVVVGMNSNSVVLGYPWPCCPFPPC
jgi:gluconokinase